MKKKVVAIIQAHMSSTRLPGKIMKDICGEPALYRMLERVKQSKLLDDIVVATSDLECDNIIVEKCEEWGIHYSRGSDSDVLSRYWIAACKYPADVYVRLTSDCPLIDAYYLDKTIEYFLENDYRYVNNGTVNIPATFPLGIGCEVFTADLLKEDVENAADAYDHEHVTPYMYLKQNSIGVYSYKENVHHYRITLDTFEDYEVISKVYDALYTPGNTFGLEDILTFFEEHPEVAAINSEVIQNKAKGLNC